MHNINYRGRRVEMSISGYAYVAVTEERRMMWFEVVDIIYANAVAAEVSTG